MNLSNPLIDHAAPVIFPELLFELESATLVPVPSSNFQ